MNGTDDELVFDSGKEQYLSRLKREKLALYGERKYDLEVFRPLDSIRTYDDEGECTVEAPYRGQSFDHSKSERIEGGWDHEHCDVCYETIREGDVHWASTGGGHITFCRYCYSRISGANS